MLSVLSRTLSQHRPPNAAPPPDPPQRIPGSRHSARWVVMLCRFIHLLHTVRSQMCKYLVVKKYICRGTVAIPGNSLNLPARSAPAPSFPPLGLTDITAVLIRKIARP